MRAHEVEVAVRAAHSEAFARMDLALARVGSNASRARQPTDAGAPRVRQTTDACAVARPAARPAAVVAMRDVAEATRIAGVLLDSFAVDVVAPEAAEESVGNGLSLLVTDDRDLGERAARRGINVLLNPNGDVAKIADAALRWLGAGRP